VFSSKIKAISC